MKAMLGNWKESLHEQVQVYVTFVHFILVVCFVFCLFLTACHEGEKKGIDSIETTGILHKFTKPKTVNNFYLLLT